MSRTAAAPGLRPWPFFGRMVRAGCHLALPVLASALLAACAGLPATPVLPPETALPPSPATALGAIAEASRCAAEESGFRLMPLAEFALDARIALIRRATQSLDVQYFQIGNDATGRLILRELRDAALRGARVRLLLDDLGTEGLDELLLGLAATPQVQVRLFNPFAAARASLPQRITSALFEFKRLGRRMHNKLFIADGAMAVVGGRNLADEYFMRSAEANFVDLDLFSLGAVLPALSDNFDRYWNSPYVRPVGEIVPTDRDGHALRAGFDRATVAAGPLAPTDAATRDVLGYRSIAHELDAGRLDLVCAPAEVYADAPSRVEGLEATYAGTPLTDVETVRFNVIESIHRARHSVVALSPYLIPGPEGLAWISRLQRRGVAMTLVTNSLASSDVALAHASYATYREAMLRVGVDLYELSAVPLKQGLRSKLLGETTGRLHAKSAVIDGELLFVGSLNFDPRSAQLNTEIGLLIHSPRLSAQVLAVADLIRHQGSFHLRMRPDGSGIEWIDESDGSVYPVEPGTTAWRRAWIRLLGWIVPESWL